MPDMNIVMHSCVMNGIASSDGQFRIEMEE